MRRENWSKLPSEDGLSTSPHVAMDAAASHSVTNGILPTPSFCARGPSTVISSKQPTPSSCAERSVVAGSDSIPPTDVVVDAPDYAQHDERGMDREMRVPLRGYGYPG